MRENINDLLAFVAVVAVARSELHSGSSTPWQSSLSRTIRRLEEQIGVRLLTRTTRSELGIVSPEHLINHRSCNDCAAR